MNVIITVIIAYIFEFLLIPLYSFQFIISGPKILWFSNHCSNFGYDFENSQAANKINGVVGIPGTTTPRKPSPTKINPKEIYKYFFIKDSNMLFIYQSNLSIKFINC